MDLNLTFATRIGLNLLALLGLAVAFWLGKNIIVPFTMAGLLAMLLYPAARFFHNKLRLPWLMSVLSMIILLIVLNLGIFIGLGSSIPRLLQDLPNPANEEEIEGAYRKMRQQIANIWPTSIDNVFPPESKDSRLFVYIRKFFEGNFVLEELLGVSRYGFSLLWESVLILFLLLFLLLEGEMLARFIREIFGSSASTQSLVTGAIEEIIEAVRAYLVWRTIVNCGLAMFLGVMYQHLGLRQPWTWALLTAILCYVPYIGTIIAGIPPILDGLIYSPTPLIALYVGILYIAVVTFEGYWIVPVVMGRSLDLNATTVLLSCLFWDLIWGTPGLFLAMPLMAAVKAICSHVPGWEPWGQLLGTEAFSHRKKKETNGTVETTKNDPSSKELSISSLVKAEQNNSSTPAVPQDDFFPTNHSVHHSPTSNHSSVSNHNQANNHHPRNPTDANHSNLDD